MYIGVPGMLDEFTSGGRILNYSLLNRFIAQIRQQLLPTSSGSYQGRLYCVVPLLFQRFAGSAVPRVSEGGGAPSLVSTRNGDSTVGPLFGDPWEIVTDIAD